MEKSNKLASMPMNKLVWNMSLPLMVSLLVQSLYNIVDSIFVAKLSQEALTATSLAFPAQLFMIAFAVGSGVGVNALLSKNLGAKNKEMVGNTATTGLLISLAGTLVFALCGLFGAYAFTGSFTDDPVIAQYAGQYLSICMIWCGGSLISTMYQRFLQAAGDAFYSMLSLIAGALTNLILDPIMIFGLFGCPALGVSGAAIATVIGQWVCAAVAVGLNTFKNPAVNLELKQYHFSWGLLKQIYQVGLPTICMQALGSIMVACMNTILMPFSTAAVAFFGVYYKLQNFLFMPMNGLGQAAIPIVGFSYGAKNYKRIMEAIKTILPIGIIIALIVTVIFLAFPQALLSLFSPTAQVLAIGVPALRIISITFTFSSITMIIGYTLSGLGNGLVNMVATALRQLVILVPLAALFARVFGINYVWFAMWISEGIAFVYVVWAGIRELKKKGILSSVSIKKGGVVYE
jgi:putative MATE family efflux protein